MTVNIVDETLNTALNKQVALTPLLHELQLGEQLNTCVHQSRRSDFSLMLAMLCDDVREQSQFILPTAPPLDGTSTDQGQVTSQTLRKYFELPEKSPLALKNIAQIEQYNQAKLIADNNLTSLHLLNALTPNPLTFRDDNKHIATDVLTNTSLVCQGKHVGKQEEKVMNKPLNMQVEAWLKAIQTALVKSNWVDTAA